MKPCLVCGAPSVGSRCPEHELEPRRGARYARLRNRVMRNATTCAVCGRPPTPDDPLTLGHIVARANGGQLVESNLQPEHLSCNLAKGAS